MRFPLRRTIAAATWTCAAAAAAAQEPARPTAIAVRTDTAPVIDGRLDDAVWGPAIPIGPLTQIEPVEGAIPSEDTDIRILYDEGHLYIGVRCFDRDTRGIVGTQMQRDAVLDPDDRVEIVIDTYLDRRNAFFFQMNPVGSKGDALISNNGQDFNKPWDGIWEGRSSIDDRGWSFEMALPFKTLNFAEDLSTWGLNVNRYIKRRNELARWAGLTQDQEIFHIAIAGDLTGLVGLRQGVGIDFVPFFAASYENDRTEGPDADLTGQPGFDLFYKITPNLTAILTVNTDFAETEVDSRRINLTRFPLFFPEKRDFFLQDAGIFEFGSLDEKLLPFFSRRIGLDQNGGEVPILAGGKLTGRVSQYNVGVLDVQMDETELTPSNNLFVARVAKNVGAESSVGGIVTNGDPTSTDSNQLYGADYNFRTSRFGGDRNLIASAWGLKTETEGVHGDDLAFGASVGYPNDLWSWNLAASEIQENFDPKLGFVPRRGVRIYEASLEFQPRPHTEIRKLAFVIDAGVVTTTEGHVETANADLKVIGIEWESGDEFALEIVPSYEDLAEDFGIEDGITIPAGEYDFTRARIGFESALKRPVSGLLSLEAGDFFDGSRTDGFAEVSWRASRFVTTSAEYEQSHVELDQGSFTTHVGRARLDLSFTPDLSWANFAQFDNESDSLGVNSRWRWIVKPGEELFLVFNQTLEREDGSVHPRFQEVAFKISYTLRF